jgi:PAS domain S-box-containing protein
LILNTIQSYLWWGFLSRDLLLIGIIDCFFVPLLVAPLVIYFVRNTAKLEELNKALEFEIIKVKEAEKKKGRETEALYRILFENAPVGIGIVDMNGTLIAFNNAMLVPGGYTREDMATITNVSELYSTSEERDKALAVFRKRGFLHQFPVQFKRRDGTPYDALLSLRPINYQGRPCIQAMVEDVTERKKMEEALQKNELRYRALFEDSPIALCEVDIADLKQYLSSLKDPVTGDMRTYFENHPEAVHRCAALISVVDRNKAMLELFGANTKEDLRQNLTNIFHEESYDHFRADILMLMANRKSYEHESVGQTLAGEKINIVLKWFSAAGYDEAGSRVIASFIDITGLKRVEKSLTTSREWFRKLVETMNEGLGIQDERGLITYVNERFCQMVGYSADELIGKQLSGFLDETNRKILEKHIANRKKGDKTPYDIRWTKKDGEGIYTVISPQPLFDETGQYTGSFATLTDITDRKRAEEALRESEERLRKLSDNVPSGLVYQIDTGEDGQQRRFLYISAGVEQLHGITAGEALSDAMSIYGQVIAEDRLRLAEEEAFAVANMVPFDTEVRLRLPSGEIRWRLFTSAPRRLPNNHVVWDGIEIDITERKSAERSLKESEDRFRITLLNSPIVVFNQDRNLRFTLIYNPRYGHAQEDVIGKTDADVCEIENIGRLTEIKQRVIESGISAREEVCIQYAGKLLYYDSYFEPLHDPDGSIIGLTGVAIDITERKQYEELIRSYQGQLSLMASKLSLVEEKERRRIAKNLHDNIGQILACAKLKLGELNKSCDADCKPNLKQIYNLVEQSILYTRSLTAELSVPILYEMGIEPAVAWLGREFQKNHSVQFHIRDDGLDKPLNDDLRIVLFKAIRELLTNVAKHAQAKNVTVSLARKNGSIQVTVEDDGVGFDVADIQRGPRIQTCFGLFSIREALKNSGGSIGIDSAPGRATRVTLTAPLEKR